jgi:hypothetical protein
MCPLQGGNESIFGGSGDHCRGSRAHYRGVRLAYRSNAQAGDLLRTCSLAVKRLKGETQAVCGSEGMGIGRPPRSKSARLYVHSP